MNPTASRRIVPSLLKAAGWIAIAALAMIGCEDEGRLTGTSVGTGNPTEIQLGFKDGSGSVALSGRVSVYAATQIPVEGLSPAPLLTLDLHDADSALLKAEDFAALVDSQWPKGSVKDGNYAFNLVVTGPSHGAIVKGFAYKRKISRFVLRPEDSAAMVNEDEAEIRLPLAPLVDVTCTIDSLDPVRNHYLFVYGTGYSAKDSTGTFVFKSIPAGSHSVHYIDLPRKDVGGSGPNDSLYIVDVKGDIAPGGANSLRLGEIHASIPTPDSLKTK